MQLQDCWNTIGTWSKAAERCERLARVGHCTNCDVYKAAGRKLLDRMAPEGYLQEWSSFLASPLARVGSGAAFFLFCELSGVTWGLRTALLEQVTNAVTIRRLPHQHNPHVLGVTHIRGDVLPCLSFAALLGLSAKESRATIETYRRFVVCEIESRRWVLPVVEVLGLQRIEQDSIQPIPLAEALNPEHALSAGFVTWKNGRATMLDPDRLGAALRQVAA